MQNPDILGPNAGGNFIVRSVHTAPGLACAAVLECGIFSHTGYFHVTDFWRDGVEHLVFSEKAEKHNYCARSEEGRPWPKGFNQTNHQLFSIGGLRTGE